MAKRLVDHHSIMEWANQRGACPARLATAARDEADPGLRLQFATAGHSTDEPLVPISWDEWFTTFDAFRLALVVDDREFRWPHVADAGHGPH